MNSANEREFWTAQDFCASAVPLFAKLAYEEVLPYVCSFLTAPHPFREGSMCPFVPAALKEQKIFFTACSKNDNPVDHADKIQKAIEFYLSSKKAVKSFGAVIILFPKDYDIGKLLELHFQNKESCVRNSLMLGALYPTNQGHSLFSKDYYPLRTPVPVLVIRDLIPVDSDLALLDQKHESLKKRIFFLTCFIRTFGRSGESNVQRLVRRAQELLQKNKRKKMFFWGILGLAILLLSALCTFLVLSVMR